MAAADRESEAPPWQRVEATLLATARAVRHAFDAGFAELDLNLTQASLLAFVHEAGPITQSALAARLSTGRAATGLIIDQLEARELIERCENPDDRRAWLIALRPEGMRIVARVGEIDTRLQRQLRNGISRPERQELARLLLRLQANVDTMAATSGD